MENYSKYPYESINTLKIAGVQKESIVDGPGIRYVVFTQGCPHHCKGCHNPQTHDFSGGSDVSIEKIAEDIKKNPMIKGVTISGGEPFMQAKQVSRLIDDLKDKNYDIMVYKGYNFENLVKNADENNGYMDGRFVEELKNENTIFRGSTNQRAIECKNSLDSGNIVIHNFEV